MKKFTLNNTLRFVLTLVAGAIMAACKSPPPAAPSTPAPNVTPAPTVTAPQRPAAVTPPAAASNARTMQEYRREIASHLYRHNNNRIHKGKLPPLLYAVGVLSVELDGRGNVVSTNWMRAPTHAPEVMSEIIRTVRAAAPYPAYAHGKVTYTDTWLWDKSGRFQLDTLSEGQL